MGLYGANIAPTKKLAQNIIAQSIRFSDAIEILSPIFIP